jgi:Tol biopolymer transport system component
MNADGTDKHEVVAPSPAGTTDLMDRSASWSPDGARIAFVRDAGTATGLLTMNADGSDPQFVINSLIYLVGTTSWSPDGVQIAFDNDVDSCSLRLRIELVNADGSTRHVLVGDTACPGEATQAQSASWSPDGTQIAYQGNALTGPMAGTTGIWVVDADGANPVQLTGDRETPLTWLPHENRIAFIRGVTIWTMKPDGTDQVSVAAID